jgi:hypothetical protein
MFRDIQHLKAHGGVEESEVGVRAVEHVNDNLRQR